MISLVLLPDSIHRNFNGSMENKNALSQSLGIRCRGLLTTNCKPPTLTVNLLLHQRSAGFCQRATLAFGQANVCGDSLIFQPIPGINETIRAAVYVRVVDLSRIPNHD